MPERKADNTGPCDEHDDAVGQHLARRRLLQLTGAGIVGGALATGSAMAAGSSLPHVITFDGSATSRTAEYQFSVSDAVAANTDIGGLESGDAIDGTTVSGSVTGDVDAYRFSGTLTGLDVSGVVDVSISYGDTTSTSTDRLEIVTPENGSVTYTFDCDGAVERVLDNGRNSAERTNDAIAENDDGTYTVTGATGNGYGDSFDLSGDVTSFEPVEGEFTLFLNGTETTVAELTGQSSGGDSGSDEPEVHVLEIVAPNSVEYAFSATGEITPDLDNGRNSAESSNDDVTQNADGSWTATGSTGNGYGDTYGFEGQATAFDVLSGDCVLYLDGTEVTIEELTGETSDGDQTEKTLDEAVFKVGFGHDDWLDYRLHVDSEPEGLTSSDDEYYAASNYDVQQLADGTWLVDGRTGTADPSGPTYGDGYRWQPADGDGILGWEAVAPDDQGYVVTLNGDDVDPATLPALDLPERDTSAVAQNGPIGGGSGYANAVTQSDADFVVRSQDELESALYRAGSGDVVFVPGGVTIDAGSGRMNVPAGVTLASNRGVNGSQGAHVHTDQEPRQVFRLSRNTRVTGLRISGPNPGAEGGDSSLACAIEIFDDGVEIDNCDVWGFAYAGVMVREGDAHIHHNVIRECNKPGLGYGVSMGAGHPVIEYNYFNFNRHSTASAGDHHGYTARYNHFGPESTSYVIDAHDPACVRIEVHNNVVEADEVTYGQHEGNIVGTCKVRGIPDDVALFRDNWFFNPREPLDSPSGNSGEAIVQWADVSDWRNVEFYGNSYGADAPVSFGDVIPGYDGWRSP